MRRRAHGAREDPRPGGTMPFVLWTSAVRTAGLLALAGWLAVAPAAGAAGLTIGTGHTAGVDHPVGVAVADLTRAEISGLGVAGEITGGPLENKMGKAKGKERRY